MIRFMIIVNFRLSNRQFAGQVFMVWAALHNYIERSQALTPAHLVAHVPTTNPFKEEGQGLSIKGQEGGPWAPI